MGTMSTATRSRIGRYPRRGAVLSWHRASRRSPAAYVQDKIEFSDIILNLGLRYDYIDPDSKDVTDPANLTFNNDDMIIASTSYRTTEKTQQFSPRIGFSFPVTDRTVFHAQYGKFIQQTKLRDSYLGASQYGRYHQGRILCHGHLGMGSEADTHDAV